jgi:exo-beta-1,3-glucanase (GH17 family)
MVNQANLFYYEVDRSGFPSSVKSSSSLLGKSHIALAPMNGVRYFFVWSDATDVNRISSNGANMKTYSSICIEFQYLVRATKGRLILVFGTLAQHDLVIDVIGVQDSSFVFVLIVLLNQTLFTCVDVFPGVSADCLGDCHAR